MASGTTVGSATTSRDETEVAKNLHSHRPFFVPARLLCRPGKQPPLPRTASYALLLHVRRRVSMFAGSLGWVSLPSGYYFYVGSARRCLSSRLARHMRRQKKRHWHVDHLTSAPGVQALGAIVAPASGECELVQRLRDQHGCVPAIAGFGASDCVRHCGGHLLLVTDKSWVIGDEAYAQH